MRYLAAIAVLALAGQTSGQASAPPASAPPGSSPSSAPNTAPGIRERAPGDAPAGPGRKGSAPGSGGSIEVPGATAPRLREDPRARREQAEWKDAHPGKVYRYGEDAAHRVVFVTCLDESSHDEMLRMLGAQADQQASTLFDALPDTEVFLAVATPADIRRIFADSQTTAGMYEHPKRRLVTADIGTVLRHEWTHAMHFGHMERLGQPHMMWVQEGIAALYETYEISPEGTIRFLPSDRHNEARKMAANRRALSLSQVIVMTPDEFMAKSAVLYPVVRSVFEYMADQGKLRPWYRRYVETFAQDRTGRKAIEDTFGTTIDGFETAWRAWVLARPAVDTAVGQGERDVGVEVKDATDGVQVTKVARGSAAQRAGIRAGDVIVAVGGTPVRSQREWRQATGAIRVPELAVTLRREGKRTEITLVFDRQARATDAAPAGSTNVLPAGSHGAGICAGLLEEALTTSEG